MLKITNGCLPVTVTGATGKPVKNNNPVIKTLCPIPALEDNLRIFDFE